MTPMTRDVLTRTIKEGNRLFATLGEYLDKFKNAELSSQETERIKTLGEEIFLFEDQLHRKTYGNDLLILSPMAHSLSMLTKSMLLGKGLGCVMFTLSAAFLPTQEEGKGTRLLGPALEMYAKKLVKTFTSAFFPRLDSSGERLFENMALLYLGASFSIGVLALGVEKEDALEEASDEIKKRVELTKEIALVYASLFLQMVMQQRFVEVCITEDSLKKPYGTELEKTPAATISAILEFAFLGCFIQGLYSQDKRKGEYLFKQLHGILKERARVFEGFVQTLNLNGENSTLKTPFAAMVTELKMSLEYEEVDLFIEALDGLISSFGIDINAFYNDLEDLHQLIQSLAFIISIEELRQTTKQTGTVQV